MTVKDNEREIDALKQTSKEVHKFLFGNGVEGLDERFRTMEKAQEETQKRIGVIESNLEHFRRVYFEREGLDALGNPKEKTDEEKKAEEKEQRKQWTPQQIILFQALVTFLMFIAGWLFTEIFPRILTIPGP